MAQQIKIIGEKLGYHGPNSVAVTVEITLMPRLFYVCIVTALSHLYGASIKP